jgi:hypothetical protein
MDEKHHDYQNEMSVDTRSIDTAGELAAEATTAKTAPVGEETIVKQVGNQKQSTSRGTFGVLPDIVIPPAYARDKMFEFKNMAIKTGTQRNPLDGSLGERTAAYKTQKKVAEKYLADTQTLEFAQRDYDTLVPLSELAAKSFAKSHAVGELLGFSDQRGPKLGAKEQRAMSKAARRLHSPLGEELSLDAASRDMDAARALLNAATSHLAATARDVTVDNLMKEYEKASTEKRAIEAKIKQAQDGVAFLASAAMLVAGGAGFVHANLSVGRPYPLAGKSADEIDLRNSTVEGMSHIAPGKATTTIASSAVAFGVKLYYAEQLTRIERTKDVVGSLIVGANEASRRSELDAAFEGFTHAQLHYRDTTLKYQARMNDRRKDMASLGREADRIADPTGRQSKASDALLWATTIMETQSCLSTALACGNSMSTTVNNASRELHANRQQHWGVLSDVYTGSPTPRVEGDRGPDMVALQRMRASVSHWLDGANDVAETIDGVASSQGTPTLEAVGYTAKY